MPKISVRGEHDVYMGLYVSVYVYKYIHTYKYICMTCVTCDQHVYDVNSAGDDLHGVW
jgi:hypothetical protein